MALTEMSLTRVDSRQREAYEDESIIESQMPLILLIVDNMLRQGNKYTGDKTYVLTMFSVLCALMFVVPAAGANCAAVTRAPWYKNID